MTGDAAAARWQRVRELFDEALERAPEEREAFLAGVRAEDPSLAADVAALVDADARAAERLGHAVRDAAALAVGMQEQPWEGRRVGPWRLVRELGKGGMGAVYLAEPVDGAFTQQVALKLIRRGMGSDQILRRFEAERQILARLEHSSIARLVDGGLTPDGHPWFAMELVEGDPIDRYCSAHGLDVKARLRLFIDVCRAVGFAHSRLVVHRDLKPDNILVSKAGQVRLLDFGIAKVIEDLPDGGTLTRTGLRLMTPGYASPEQVRGEPVDTTTDIYSLGVILYELLTGERPLALEGKSLGELERIVSETIPAPPSTRVAPTSRLRRVLAGDLDVICLKALRKEPERRYGTVEAFLDDVQRHLDGRPVLARPDTWRYRVRKFATRNLYAVAATAAGVVMLASMTGVYLTGVAAERDVARAESAKAAEVVRFLQGLFEVSDPSESRGDSVTARELLDAGAARIERELAGEPEVQATMMRVIGEVYASIGLAQRGLPLIAGALERHRALYGNLHAETASSALALGVLRQDLGEFEAAGPLIKEAVATRTALFGTPHAEVSRALRDLSFWEETRGDEAEAERLLVEALAQDRQLFAPDDERVVDALVRLGGLRRRMGKRVEAEPVLREGLAAQRRIHGDTHPRVASTMRNLGSLLRDLDRQEEAESLYIGTIAILRALHGPVHPEVAVALNSYAILLANVGKVEQAIEAQREIIAQFDAIYGGPHPNTAAAHHNLAEAYRSAGRFDDAERSFRRAIDVQVAVLPPGHPNLARPWQGLGNLFRDQRKFVESERAFRRALEIRRAALPRGHSLRLETLRSLMLVAEDRGSSDVAAGYREQFEAEESARP